MFGKKKAKLMVLAVLIFCSSVATLLARDIGRSALGGAIKGGIIGKASGGRGGRGAMVGAGIGVIQSSSRQQGARQQQAQQQQVQQQQAHTQQMQVRQAERDAEARARREYEAKLRKQKERERHVDYRQPQQQQQINAISGQQVYIDMYEHPEAWDERARHDIQMIEQRYGKEAGTSMRKRIAQLQKSRRAVLKGKK